MSAGKYPGPIEMGHLGSGSTGPALPIQDNFQHCPAERTSKDRLRSGLSERGGWILAWSSPLGGKGGEHIYRNLIPRGSTAVLSGKEGKMGLHGSVAEPSKRIESVERVSAQAELPHS